MQEHQGPKPEIHLLVCTNDRRGRSEMPSCGEHISIEDVKSLKMWIRAQGLTGRVQCTKTGCLGHCNRDGGVIFAYPDQKIYRPVNSVEEIKQWINDLSL